MWDGKFAGERFLYGRAPNAWLKPHIDRLESAQEILFLGEGEGRNACYAAAVGHHCTAIDASAVGLAKLQELMRALDVQVETHLMDLAHWRSDTQYDAIMCSFLHLDPELRRTVFSHALEALKPGGWFVGEFFSVDQLRFRSGGPKQVDLLYRCEDFEALSGKAYHCETLEQTEVELDEGAGHQGAASVIRVTIRKE